MAQPLRVFPCFPEVLTSDPRAHILVLLRHTHIGGVLTDRHTERNLKLNKNLKFIILLSSWQIENQNLAFLQPMSYEYILCIFNY